LLLSTLGVGPDDMAPTPGPDDTPADQ
jgi:hypothetical protein